jgi:hypothetical protein
VILPQPTLLALDHFDEHIAHGGAQVGLEGMARLGAHIVNEFTKGYVSGHGLLLLLGWDLQFLSRAGLFLGGALGSGVTDNEIFGEVGFVQGLRQAALSAQGVANNAGWGGVQKVQALTLFACWHLDVVNDFDIAHSVVTMDGAQHQQLSQCHIAFGHSHTGFAVNGHCAIYDLHTFLLEFAKKGSYPKVATLAGSAIS